MDREAVSDSAEFKLSYRTYLCIVCRVAGRRLDPECVTIHTRDLACSFITCANTGGSRQL